MNQRLPRDISSPVDGDRARRLIDLLFELGAHPKLIFERMRVGTVYGVSDRGFKMSGDSVRGGFAAGIPWLPLAGAVKACDAVFMR
ncbi:hypothetical protein EVAR_27490_1 [Eumeta japonica]|uniref:Uncharacterized protein n=1 Tax=Eumeta variegata TaxID=151549 RepID=A0A4C1XEJ6_EUMVA|nr:hypothetical protein EVAR_27490_1 [Eumeta japonica]